VLLTRSNRLTGCNTHGQAWDWSQGSYVGLGRQNMRQGRPAGTSSVQVSLPHLGLLIACHVIKEDDLITQLHLALTLE
jgi:hypothetical protein